VAGSSVAYKDSVYLGEVFINRNCYHIAFSMLGTFHWISTATPEPHPLNALEGVIKEEGNGFKTVIPLLSPTNWRFVAFIPPDDLLELYDRATLDHHTCRNRLTFRELRKAKRWCYSRFGKIGVSILMTTQLEILNEFVQMGICNPWNETIIWKTFLAAKHHFVPRPIRFENNLIIWLFLRTT